MIKIHGTINWQYIILLFVVVSLMSACNNSPDHLYLINEDGLYGYIDSSGKIVIKPSYLYAAKFSDDVALVVSDTTHLDLLDVIVNYHYIDKKGRTVGRENYATTLSVLNLMFKMESVLSQYSYSEGRAFYKAEESINGSCGYIDKRGEVVIPCEYSDGGLFHDGKTMVQQPIVSSSNDSSGLFQLWKVIDCDGHPLTDYMFIKECPFDHNRCVAPVFSPSDRKNNFEVVYVLLDENARVIKTFTSPGFKKISNGVIIDEARSMAMFGVESSFYNLDGKVLPTFPELPSAEKKRIINLPSFAGNLTGKIKCSYIKGYSEGLCLCTNGEENCDKWFFIDVYMNIYGNTNSELVIFEDALPFSSGFAAIKLNGKWGFINHDFEIVIPCQYDKADSFDGELAMVEIKHPSLRIKSYINKEGRPVWQNTKYLAP